MSRQNRNDEPDFDPLLLEPSSETEEFDQEAIEDGDDSEAIQLVSESVAEQLKQLTTRKQNNPLEGFFHQIAVADDQFMAHIRSQQRRPIVFPKVFCAENPASSSSFAQEIASAARLSPVFMIGTFSPSGSKSGFHLARKLSTVSGLHLIQSDLIIDPYQIYEARWHGFAAVSIYPSCLSASECLSLILMAKELGMHSIVWIRSRQDLVKALKTPTPLFGIASEDRLGSLEGGDTQLLQLAAEVPPDRLLIVEPKKIDSDMSENLRELDTFAVIKPLARLFGSGAEFRNL